MKNRKIISVLVTLVAAVILSGCVERKLTINTEPQGANVFLNDEDIGISPVTVEFNWYGDYKVRLTKAGYAITNTHKNLKAPLKDRFPFDFFFETISPGRHIDEYEWTFKLSPYVAPNRDDLIESAQQFKAKTIEELKMYELRKPQDN